jgi:hypothetical protein
MENTPENPAPGLDTSREGAAAAFRYAKLSAEEIAQIKDEFDTEKLREDVEYEETRATAKKVAAKPVRKPRKSVTFNMPEISADEYMAGIEASSAERQDAFLTNEPVKPVLTFHWVAGFYPVEFGNKHGAWGADMCAVHAPLDMEVTFYTGTNPPVRTATEQVFNNWFTDGLVDVRFDNGLPVYIETKDAIFVRRD